MVKHFCCIETSCGLFTYPLRIIVLPSITRQNTSVVTLFSSRHLRLHSSRQIIFEISDANDYGN